MINKVKKDFDKKKNLILEEVIISALGIIAASFLGSVSYNINFIKVILLLRTIITVSYKYSGTLFCYSCALRDRP